MFTRSAIIFPLVLAVLLALITFWVSQSVEEQGQKIDGSNRHDPDYSMNNFVTTQMGKTGTLRYILAAKEMVHYPDDDSTVLQRPRFTQYTANKPYTQIEGLRGYVSSNGEEVELVDNVKVVRQAFEGKGEMQVLTEKLVILPNQDIAKTDSPVVITQAPKTVIHATGMIYDKKKQTVQLFKRVKVHYERPALVKAKVISKKPSAQTLMAKTPAKLQAKAKAKATTEKTQQKTKQKTEVKPKTSKVSQALTKKSRSKQ